MKRWFFNLALRPMYAGLAIFAGLVLVIAGIYLVRWQSQCERYSGTVRAYTNSHGTVVAEIDITDNEGRRHGFTPHQDLFAKGYCEGDVVSIVTAPPGRPSKDSDLQSWMDHYSLAGVFVLPGLLLCWAGFRSLITHQRMH